MFGEIEKDAVIRFFDDNAADWDARMKRNDEIINIILDNTGVEEGKDVLDVACGTGVLIPDYLKRNVKFVTAIDISPKMIEIAKSKFHQDNVEIICGDVEGYEFDKQFDCIVIYNAFPHFPNPDTLICCLAGLLRKGGKLTVAHGMSRAQLDDHHNDVAAQQISNGLMPASWLNEIFAKYLKVTKIIDSTFYQVVGKK